MDGSGQPAMGVGRTYKLWMEVVTRPEKRYYFSIRTFVFFCHSEFHVSHPWWDRPERLPFAAKSLGLQTELAQFPAEKTKTRTSVVLSGAKAPRELV